MGCDLEICVEHRAPDGPWRVLVGSELPELPGRLEPYGVLHSERSYLLFGHMAGVRQTPCCRIGDTRGLPPDVSDHVLDLLGPTDALDPSSYPAEGISWLSLRECIEHDWPEEIRDLSFLRLVRALQDAGFNPDRTRFVFSFWS